MLKQYAKEAILKNSLLELEKIFYRIERQRIKRKRRKN